LPIAATQVCFTQAVVVVPHWPLAPHVWKPLPVAAHLVGPPIAQTPQTPLPLQIGFPAGQAAAFPH
jgi:hypothetical protein